MLNGYGFTGNIYLNSITVNFGFMVNTLQKRQSEWGRRKSATRP